MTARSSSVPFTGKETIEAGKLGEIEAWVVKVENSFASYTLLLTKKAPPYILRVEVTRRRGGARMIYELE
ncbi:MAG: hypothetical protein GY711_12095 [bacterium]|nr:hypothetical protein [bacterium]